MPRLHSHNQYDSGWNFIRCPSCLSLLSYIVIVQYSQTLEVSLHFTMAIKRAGEAMRLKPF